MLDIPLMLRPAGPEFLNNPGDLPRPIERYLVTLKPAASNTDRIWRKPVLDWHGERTVAELVIAGEFKKLGWDAYWVSSGGLRNCIPEVGRPLRVEQLADALPFRRYPRLRIKLDGAWDVLAWRGEEVRFYEVKWDGRKAAKQIGRRDSFRPSQIEFLKEMIDQGAQPSQFGIVEWTMA